MDDTDLLSCRIGSHRLLPTLYASPYPFCPITATVVLDRQELNDIRVLKSTLSVTLWLVDFAGHGRITMDSSGYRPSISHLVAAPASSRTAFHDVAPPSEVPNPGYKSHLVDFLTRRLHHREAYRPWSLGQNLHDGQCGLGRNSRLHTLHIPSDRGEQRTDCSATDLPYNSPSLFRTASEARA
ncbi:hypothetical protein VTN96DRAFT_98 [Rasamsonia emersonii]